MEKLESIHVGEIPSTEILSQWPVLQRDITNLSSHWQQWESSFPWHWVSLNASVLRWMLQFCQIDFCFFFFFLKIAHVLICIFLMKVKVIQLCLTLCNPMDCTVRGILQARILEWVAISFSRGSSQPRDRTQVSLIAGRFFTSWPTKEAQLMMS